MPLPIPKPLGSSMKLLLSVCVLVIVVVVSLLVGSYSIDVWSAFVASDGSRETFDTAIAIMVHSRLPRALAAIGVGACLSVAGAVYQGIFRNPLVSPDMLGASAGAACGAAVGIVSGFGIRGVEVLSFAMGIVAVAATWVISSSASKRRGSLVLILSGILVSTLFTSMLSLTKFLADPYSKLPDITFWLLGSLSAVNMSDAAFVAVCAAAGLVPLVIMRWRLNVLSLDEDEARCLGISVCFYRWLVIVCATLLTSAAVSVCGLIGWVGLVVPHIARLIFGPDYSTLVAASVVLGGTYLLVVDTVSRCAATVEIPLGIPTAIVGAPFLFFLMRRAEREWG